MDRSQETFSAENREGYIQSERTQQAERFLSRNLVSAIFSFRVLFKRILKVVVNLWN